MYLQGKDLADRDLNGLSDPYVRITLLPDKKHRLETKIKRRTLNPKWNETFYFEGNTVEDVRDDCFHYLCQGFLCPSYRLEFCIFMFMIMTGEDGWLVAWLSFSFLQGSLEMIPLERFTSLCVR